MLKDERVCPALISKSSEEGALGATPISAEVVHRALHEQSQAHSCRLCRVTLVLSVKPQM